MTDVKTSNSSLTASLKAKRSDGSLSRGSRSGFGRPLAGVLLVVLSSLAFMVIYASVGHRKEVLVVAHDVAAGQVIKASDLTTARVSLDPKLRPIDVSDSRDVIGKVTAVNLVSGTLVTKGQIATGPLVSEGEAVVGLSLKAGQLPLDLHSGDHVMVIQTPNSASESNSTTLASPVLVADATVFGTAPTNDSTGATVVSLMTTTDFAPSVAQSAAIGLISLVKTGQQ